MKNRDLHNGGLYFSYATNCDKVNRMRVSLPVTEILNTVRPPMWDGDWDSYFEVYHNDPLEWDRIETLALEILERGQLEPGRIDYDEDDSLWLGNGNHRLYATILLGLDTYDVTYGLKWTDEREVPQFYLSTHLVLSTDYTRDDNTEDDIFNTMHGLLNFRLNDAVWVELESMFSTGTGVGMEFDLGFTHIPDEHIPAFAEKVLERLSRCIDTKRIQFFSAKQEYMFNEDAPNGLAFGDHGNSSVVR